MSGLLLLMAADDRRVPFYRNGQFPTCNARPRWRLCSGGALGLHSQCSPFFAVRPKALMKSNSKITKYGVPPASTPPKQTPPRVEPTPGGGWAVRASNGRVVHVGSAESATVVAQDLASARHEVVLAADKVIQRHHEVIRRLAKR